MLGVKASTYITATLIGIVPGTFTYAVVGGGLDSIIEAQRQACAARQECGLDLTVSSLLTPQIIAAFVLLALLALLPPLAKRVLRRKAGAGAPMPEDRGEG